MYATSIYPPKWKESYIHFIKKSDGRNVRPIYLSSCLSKLFETLLKNKLQWWAERNNILPNSQSGFRKGQSTVNNLTNLILSAEESFSNKNGLLATFLDVSGAFDNVIIDILIQQMADIGCPLQLIKFVKTHMSERLIYTDLTGTTARKVHKGVPQGGVLSPLLYCIYVAKIVEKLPKSVKISQFADDIALYCSRSSLKSCIKLLEKAIDLLYNNLYDLGLDRIGYYIITEGTVST